MHNLLKVSEYSEQHEKSQESKPILLPNKKLFKIKSAK